jgi:hypothetical protein
MFKDVAYLSAFGAGAPLKLRGRNGHVKHVLRTFDPLFYWTASHQLGNSYVHGSVVGESTSGAGEGALLGNSVNTFAHRKMLMHLFNSLVAGAEG